MKTYHSCLGVSGTKTNGMTLVPEQGVSCLVTAGVEAGGCDWALELNSVLRFGDYVTWSSVRISCHATVRKV